MVNFSKSLSLGYFLSLIALRKCRDSFCLLKQTYFLKTLYSIKPFGALHSFSDLDLLFPTDGVTYIYIMFECCVSYFK